MKKKIHLRVSKNVMHNSENFFWRKVDLNDFSLFTKKSTYQLFFLGDWTL